MIELLSKIEELTKEQIPTDPVEQKKFAIQLINGIKIDIAQYCNKLERETVEEHLFKAEVLSETAAYVFRFSQLHLSKKHNLKIDKLWEAKEETRAAKKPSYESGNEQAKKARKKKAKASGDEFEKRGKSVDDRVVIDIAKALMGNFKHLPDVEAKAAALQMARAHFEKLQGKK